MLVEGASDRAAIETLAALRDVDLAAAGVEVVAMGGATSIRHFLAQHAGNDGTPGGALRRGRGGLVPPRPRTRGYGKPRDRCDLEALGFFVCDADLEDELIRALGVTGVERVVEMAGDLRALRSLQKQPAQRDWAAEDQVRRFLGSGSGRKVRYARLLVEALAPEQVPRPLDRLLAYVTAG